MNKLLRGLQRPEFVFRPVQLWRRLRRRAVQARGDVRLAWGLPIRITPRSLIDTDILNLGVYDRIVPETICRLLDAGEWAIDVGANIGQNASIMALAAGPGGRVLAFEPHPALWPILNDNVVDWRAYDLAPIHTVRKGLGSSVTRATLYEGEEFAAGNRGSASLEAPSRVVRAHEIEVTTLEAALPADARIGLIKLDVEGHEHAVLLGAEALLREQRLRDVLFEDHHPQPSRVTRLLEAAGYGVFTLIAGWHRPRLVPWREAIGYRSAGLRPINHLATLDVERTRARFRRAGWSCLRVRAEKAAASGRARL